MARHTIATLASSMVETSLAPESEGSCISLTKKELGAYYTPTALASLLAQWAIRSANEHILEPGFGGCGFLEAAIDRLSEFGNKNPKSQLYGCDIDPQAFAYLSEKLGVLSIDRRYILSDFVAVFPQDFSVQAFDVVIGNPPYVSLHNMSESQKTSVQAWRTKTGIKINGRASLWAYFVLHAKSFLKLGGRMAWVLPGSFLEADYAASLREDLANCFDEITAIQLAERMFLSVGTEERTVVLLCSGYGGTSKGINIRHCVSANQLETEMVSHNQVENAALNFPRPTRQVQTALNETGKYDALLASPDAVKLGDLCKVLIGTVTGANRFFIMSPSDAKQHKLGKRYLKPILSRFGHIQGAQINKSDIENWQTQNRSCLLFHLPDNRVSQAAKDYVATFPEAARELNSTFRRRKDWLRADDGRIPDAFLSYMMHDGPRMVLNCAAINATNSIHRIIFHPTVTEPIRKLVVISLCSTFSQLSAERVGRSYGSGVLKIEPSEANKISLLIPKKKTSQQIDAAFAKIDTCFRQDNSTGARQIADTFLFGTDCEQIVHSMFIELEIARNRRRRQRNDN